jgi:prolyl-tRNA synthetase
VIVPILRGDSTGPVLEKADEVAARLKSAGVRVKIDARDHLSPGAKYYEWERKGVPFRVEIGPRDLEQGQLALARRLTPEGEKRKAFLPEGQAIAELPDRLDEFQNELRDTALERRNVNSVRGVKSLDELEEALDGGAGFVFTGWNGDRSVEEAVKERTKATIRALPDEEFRSGDTPTKCVSGNGDSVAEVVWARAY